MKITGISAAIFELSIFYHIAHSLKTHCKTLQQIPVVPYYWITFTILTGIWEFTFIRNRKSVQMISNQLLKDKSHVWTNHYPLFIILPWSFSKRFYAEYGAYADREYKTTKDNWSYLIEGTHAVFCGIMSAFGILSWIYHLDSAILYITISMASQLMNSILYLGEYSNQTKSIHSNNYDRSQFPLGKYWLKRPFMYINIFWTIMPIYVLYNILSGNIQ